MKAIKKKPKPKQNQKKLALVLYSGGLDSRLTVKLLQEKGYQIEALHFSLPFGCGCCNLDCNFNFTQLQGVKLTILNVTKDPLLKEYLGIIKKPKHGTGKGVNPCKDCKIWMFKKAKAYVDEKYPKQEVLIATGEVLGQRPMSQTSSAMELIDRKIGFKISRPLTEMGIVGRSRKKQMELAKKYDIKYPNPGGGCILCEKALRNRLSTLFEKDLVNEKTLALSMLGRHFMIKGNWFVVARNGEETAIVEAQKNIIRGKAGAPAVYFHKKSKQAQETATKLQKAYQDKNLKKIKEFGEFKL
jgi:tRNA-uridine 2-sulfurtransferase